MDICRVCLHTNKEMVQLFTSDSQDDVVSKIKFCTGILFTKGDNSPSKICKKCIEDMHIAHKFKTNCVRSESMFKNFIIKVEPPITIDDDSKMVDEFKEDIIKVNNNKEEVLLDEQINGDAIDDDDFTWDYDITLEVKREETEPHTKGNGGRLKEDLKNGTNDDERKLRKAGATQLHPCRKNGPKRKKKFKFKRLTCEICDIKFSDKKESDDHKKKFHSSSEKWICEICGKMIAPSSLHYHIRSHMPPQFECASCDYKCSHKYDLVKHVRIHTGSKSYICPICAQLYRTSSNLHAHVRLAHERVRRFECPTCSRMFYDRTKLNRHIDSHNDVKRYSCDVCHSCFTRRCYWKKHLLRHHGIAIPAVRPGRQRRQVQDLHLLEAGQKAS